MIADAIPTAKLSVLPGAGHMIPLENNVEVIADRLSQVRQHSIVTADGTEHEVDAIIYGTGFHVTDAYEQLDIVGSDALHVREA